MSIKIEPNSFSPSYLTNVNGTLYFVAKNKTNGSELWKTDGTESGTVLVEDINPGFNTITTLGACQVRVGWALGTKSNSAHVCWDELSLYPTYRSTLHAFPDMLPTALPYKRVPNYQ